MNSRFLKIACSFLFLNLACRTYAATVVKYVRGSLSTGSNDGSSWANAFRGSTALQDALDAAATYVGAHPGDTVQLWVYGGSYKPSTRTDAGDARSKSFVMVDHVEIYGGFTSTSDDDLSDRLLFCIEGSSNAGRPCTSDDDCPGGTSYDCPTSNPTILSGDLNSNGPDANDAYHIVTHQGDNMNVVIDGFLIQGGYADVETNGRNQGAAIHIRPAPGGNFCVAGGPTIRNCLIKGNYVSFHGAVNDHGSTVAIDNCVFKENVAGGSTNAGRGAGVTVEDGSTTISNCLFSGNTVNATVSAIEQGAALWLGHHGASGGCAGVSAPVVTNCVFESNGNYGSGNNDLDGGAVFVGSGTTATFNSNSEADNYHACTFQSNVAKRGGAAWVEGTASFTDCNFLLNSVNGIYAGAVAVSSATVEFLRCRFNGNNGGSFGLGTIWSNSTVTAVNTEIVANYAYNGGAINSDAGTVALTNCTVAHNYSAVINGSAVVMLGALTAINSIFWGNRDFISSWSCCPSSCGTCESMFTGGETAQIKTQGGGSAAVTYSDWEGHSGGTGNINSDPIFVRDADPGDICDTYCMFGQFSGYSGDESADDDYGDMRLDAASPCIDVGNNEAIEGESIDLAAGDRIVDDPNVTNLSTECRYVDMGALEVQDEDDEPCDASGNICCDGACCDGICCSDVCDPGSCCVDGDCGGGTPHCKTSGTNVCVQCTSNGHCGGSTPYCKAATNTCVQCTSDAQCQAAHSACWRCVSNTCTNSWCPE